VYSQIAIHMIAECCLDDEEKAAGMIPYIPQREGRGAQSAPRRQSFAKRTGGGGAAAGVKEQRSAPAPAQDNDGVAGPDGTETRNVPIHIGLVGCIIGKGGEFINKVCIASALTIFLNKNRFDQSLDRA
jgi:hypothetical protein